MDIFKQLLSDEKGKLSAARTLLVCCLVFSGVIIVFDSALWGDVPECGIRLAWYGVHWFTYMDGRAKDRTIYRARDSRCCKGYRLCCETA